MAYKHVRASFAGICRDTDSLQRKVKIKRYSRNYRCPEKGARGELLHTHHARLVGISNSEPVELSDREETRECRSREATVRGIISDLKSLLHHFPLFSLSPS